jgi:hypothetical protein
MPCSPPGAETGAASGRKIRGADAAAHQVGGFEETFDKEI